MKVIKLHSYAVRIGAPDGKEIIVLCYGPAEAKVIYDRLMPTGSAPFNSRKSDWVFADIMPASAPDGP